MRESKSSVFVSSQGKMLVPAGECVCAALKIINQELFPRGSRNVSKSVESILKPCGKGAAFFDLPQRPIHQTARRLAINF